MKEALKNFSGSTGRFIQRRSILVFLVLVFLLSLYFEYSQTIFMSPQSVHDWRQADCASFAMMYYRNGMHFFEPQVYNVLLGNGNAAGECPVLYYLVACLYKIFGPHDVIFRSLFLLIFYAGLISLFQLVKRITKDLFLSFFIPLLLFCSPLIMFFANNFLCDVPSLSMVFIAWNFMFKYRETSQEKHFWLGMFFFAFAALLKLNSAISILALGFLFFWELVGWMKLNNERKMFVNIKSNIAGFMAVLLVVGSWYVWAIHYNKVHCTSFLGTQSWPGWPIWEANATDFLRTVINYFAHASNVYSYVTCLILGFLFFFTILNGKRLDPFIYGIFLIILLGVIMFVCMFFVGVGDNIYYIVNLMILPVFILITSALLLKDRFPQVFHSAILKLLLSGFLVFNVSYAKGKLQEYYHYGKAHLHNNLSFYKPQFKAFVDSVGVEKNARVISYPDVTPDVTLYLIGRSGWSDYDAPHDEFTINRCIKNGARYLFINDPALLFDPVMMSYTGDYVANFGNIYIYRLSPSPKKNTLIKGILTTGSRFITFEHDEKSTLKTTTDSAKASVLSILPLGDGKVAIRTEEKKFLSCDLHTGVLTASTDWLGDWEIFKMVTNVDKTVSILGVNNKYIAVDGAVFSATLRSVTPAATFSIIYK